MQHVNFTPFDYIYNIIYVIYIYIIYYIYIDHWRILWSSYRKLAWVGSELTTTEFCSDALTDWDIRPWVQLTLRANFIQPHSNFIVCSVPSFIFAIAFISPNVCFNWSLLEECKCFFKMNYVQSRVNQEWFCSIKVVTWIVKIFPVQEYFLLQYMFCMVASQT